MFFDRRKKEKYHQAIELLNKNNISSLRKNVRILVVDDEDDELYQVLKERQYNIFYKSDMTYAIEAEPFEIVLMDIRGVAMRRKSSMEGFALACEIKEAYSLKKVCCYSGSVHKEIAAELSENKIDAFFLKDLDIDKIAEKIDKLIEDYVDYKKQWDVICTQLQKNNVEENDIEKIRKAYMQSFDVGDISVLSGSILDTLKEGTVIINIVSSVLTLLKAVVV